MEELSGILQSRARQGEIESESNQQKYKHYFSEVEWRG